MCIIMTVYFPYGVPWNSTYQFLSCFPCVKVLEKMRPIDQKMKYQIDKMIKSATTGLEGEHPWGLFF